RRIHLGRRDVRGNLAGRTRTRAVEEGSGRGAVRGGTRGRFRRRRSVLRNSRQAEAPARAPIMTSRFRVTKGARRSLQEIHTYYRDQGGQHLADRILSELYDAMVKLAEQPTLGHYRPDLTDSPFRFF